MKRSAASATAVLVAAMLVATAAGAQHYPSSIHIEEDVLPQHGVAMGYRPISTKFGNAHVTDGREIDSSILQEPNVQIEVQPGHSYTVAMVHPDELTKGVEGEGTHEIEWLYVRKGITTTNSMDSGREIVGYSAPNLSGNYHRILIFVFDEAGDVYGLLTPHDFSKHKQLMRRAGGVEEFGTRYFRRSVDAPVQTAQPAQGMHVWTRAASRQQGCGLLCGWALWSWLG